MADPTDYSPSYSFTGWQEANPMRPLPGQQVDNEFANIATSLNETIDALADIRRSDGKLKNQIVTWESFSNDLRAVYTGGAVSAWAPVVPFAAGIVAQADAPATTVIYQGETYVAASDHTTTAVFEPANWTKIAARGATGPGSGDMLAANNLSDVDSVEQAQANLGLTPGSDVQPFDPRLAPLPAGVTVPYAGTNTPSGWLFCYGQAVSRTTYADLFAAIGTTHGAGDGSTTFNVPDLRGCVVAGRDNMGGTDAGRLSGLFGDLARFVGSVFGAATHVLTTGQMPSHTHSGTTGSSGAHTHDIPGRRSDGSASDDLTRLSSGTTPVGIFTFTSMESAGAHTHSFTTGSAGSSEAHPNVQPTTIMNYIIKT